MRWFAYFLLTYVMLGVQLGVVPYVAFLGVSPNLMPLLVVFICLYATREEAMLVSFLIGATQDLVSLQPFGLFAFSYGVVAVLVCWLAESVKRGHPLTHLSLTFMATMVIGVLLLIHDLIRPISPAVLYGGTVVRAIRIGPRVVAVSAIYTTLLSPIVIFVLQQSNRIFGLDMNRRRNRV